MSLKNGVKIGSERYDFDRLIDRRGTNSMKWSAHPEDVLPLWVADMDFQSPDPVIAALRQRVEHGVFGYGVEPKELRPLILARLERLYGWRVGAEELSFLPGVVPGLNLVSRTVGEPGDGVLIQTPIYPPFLAVGSNASRTVQQAPLVRTNGRYEIDFDLLEAAITPRTRVFLLCNPHNPVGRVFTKAELERVAEICLRHDLIICSDEIHQDFVYEGHTHYPIASLSPEIADRTVTLISPSKSYNIAGFHLAVSVVGNPDLRTRLHAMAAGILPNRPGSLDYVAAAAAYSDGGPWLEQVLTYLQANRDSVVDYVSENLPGVTVFAPEATYLAWLDCREVGTPGSPGEFFMREARVALNDGPAFGAPGEGFVRLNFGCPRSILREALGRMGEALSKARES